MAYEKVPQVLTEHDRLHIAEEILLQAEDLLSNSIHPEVVRMASDLANMRVILLQRGVR